MDSLQIQIDLQSKTLALLTDVVTQNNKLLQDLKASVLHLGEIVHQTYVDESHQLPTSRTVPPPPSSQLREETTTKKSLTQEQKNSAHSTPSSPPAPPQSQSTEETSLTLPDDIYFSHLEAWGRFVSFTVYQCNALYGNVLAKFPSTKGLTKAGLQHRSFNLVSIRQRLATELFGYWQRQRTWLPIHISTSDVLNKNFQMLDVFHVTFSAATWEIHKALFGRLVALTLTVWILNLLSGCQEEKKRRTEKLAVYQKELEKGEEDDTCDRIHAHKKL